MKPLLVRESAAVLVAAAALTAACSNTDPTAPRTPDAARVKPASPVYSGYSVTWSNSGGTGGTGGVSTGTSLNGTTTGGQVGDSAAVTSPDDHAHTRGKSGR